MSFLARPSPQGKKVSLFITCMIDMLYPETGLSVVDILEHLGIEVDFPMAQTCCGQPAFNMGYQIEARQVARQFLKAFAEAEVIVTPSGSCAAMVHHEYPKLFADDPQELAQAEKIASITWEFSEFLVDGLGIENLDLTLAEPQQFAIHKACHGLRILGLDQQAHKLLSHMENAEVVELPNDDECCGFGGLFSVKMATISNAMLGHKMADIQASSVQTIVTGDVSCLTHMNGGLERHEKHARVRHLADVLAEGLPGHAD